MCSTEGPGMESHLFALPAQAKSRWKLLGDVQVCFQILHACLRHSALSVCLPACLSVGECALG